MALVIPTWHTMGTEYRDGSVEHKLKSELQALGLATVQLIKTEACARLAGFPLSFSRHSVLMTS